jgi:hypothetical protein
MIYCEYYENYSGECEHPDYPQNETGDCLLELYGECELMDGE